MDQAFENGSKIIVANDGADLVISVIDKDTPVLQHDQLRVLIMLSSLLNSTSVVDCLKTSS